MLLPEEAEDPLRLAQVLKRLPERHRHPKPARVKACGWRVSSIFPKSSATGWTNANSRFPPSRNSIWLKNDTHSYAAKHWSILKGYPRLSETFIAQELLGLERAGFDLTLDLHAQADRQEASSRSMTRSRRASSICRNICTTNQSGCCVPLLALRKKPNFKPLLKRFWADLRRDISRNRFRRLGQALVLAHEWPDAANGCMRISSTRPLPSPPIPAS